MWILNFLPDWIFYALFFIGVLGLIATYVMKFIPFVYMYRMPIQVVSIILVVIGTYMSGAISNEESWQTRVKEMEAKVAAAEIKSSQENVKIVTKVVKKLELVRTQGEEVIKYVDREVVKYDNQCVIPNEFVKALNAAAEPPK